MAKLSEAFEDVGRPVAYFPRVARAFGGVKQGLLLCQLYYWEGKQEDAEGWHHHTAEELTEQTGLSYKEQKMARRELRELGVLEEREERLLHRIYFRINVDRLNAVYDAWQQKHQDRKKEVMGLSPKSLRDFRGRTGGTLGNVPEGLSLHTDSETPPEITSETRECAKSQRDEPATLSACSGRAHRAPDASLGDTKTNGTPVWPSVEALVDLYNDLAPDECPEVPPQLSPGRRKLATQALRAFPDPSFWERVFRMLGKSPKLRGLRPSPGYENWTADFDWLLAKKDGVENYMKVHDGRYL